MGRSLGPRVCSLWALFVVRYLGFTVHISGLLMGMDLTIEEMELLKETQRLIRETFRVCSDGFDMIHNRLDKLEYGRQQPKVRRSHQTKSYYANHPSSLPEFSFHHPPPPKPKPPPDRQHTTLCTSSRFAVGSYRGPEKVETKSAM